MKINELVSDLCITCCCLIAVYEFLVEKDTSRATFFMSIAIFLCVLNVGDFLRNKLK